ncbi:MAG: hypothetical protein HQK98_02485 [Nitrospirae bacterium]|nr:hypothetical protein [Nitrospirota bacterium]
MSDIEKCLDAKAVLGTIILCGSMLEGILYGVISKYPEEERVKASPKDKSGKIKDFNDWKLNDFIEVARKIGFIDEDVKQFSHTLRTFRNYIHPEKQAREQPNPTEDTVELFLKVLKMAISQISKRV